MRWWVAVLTVLVVAADVASKEVVRETIPPGVSVPVIANVLHLTHVQNPGAAFGLFAGNALLLIIVPVAIIIMLAFMAPALTEDRLRLRLGFALLLAGAVGNLTDRVRWGYVTDFIDLQVWPVFNVADVAVVLGVGLFVIDTLQHERTLRLEEADAGAGRPEDEAVSLAVPPPPPPPPVPEPVSGRPVRGEEPVSFHDRDRDQADAAGGGGGGAH